MEAAAAVGEYTVEGRKGCDSALKTIRHGGRQARPLSSGQLQHFRLGHRAECTRMSPNQWKNGSAREQLSSDARGCSLQRPAAACSSLQQPAPWPQAALKSRSAPVARQ